MSKKKDKEEKKEPKVHKDLKGFNIEIDSFGEIHSNLDMKQLNKFLDDNVEDKKFKNRGEIKRSYENDFSEEDRNIHINNPDMTGRRKKYSDDQEDDDQKEE